MKKMLLVIHSRRILAVTKTSPKYG